MLDCFGLCEDKVDPEREPLLPVYNDDTALQIRLHEKLHTYQMLRAMSQGYMPSNEQTITHLRTLLSSEALTYDSPELSNSGRALIRSSRLFITQLVELLKNKNPEDQLQDLLWYISKARLEVDVSDLAETASRAKAKADTAAAYRSVQTVGSLLLSNSDFRIFLADLETVGRQVFRDTAFSLSTVSEKVAKKVEPSEQAKEELKEGGEENGGITKEAPSSEELRGEISDVASTLVDGAQEVVEEAGQSISEHATGEEQQALTRRLKQTVLNLRQRTDYSSSVSTLSLLLRRYLLAYSHAAADTLQAVEDDVDTNPEADRALHNAWILLRSIGSKDHWDNVEKSFQSVMEHSKTDPNFDKLVKKLSSMLQDMLSDPEFFDNADERFQEIKGQTKELVGGSSVSDDVDSLMSSARNALQSAARDKDIHQLIRTSNRIVSTLSPSGKYTNSDLVADSINVFLPMIISGIQYVPIPRLEVSTPAIDILLENLILEAGKTVNHSSFLPYKILVSSQNDIEIRKARYRTASSMKSLMRITVSGMSIAAEDIGYWFRVHSGLLRFTDEGLAGFHVDEKGVDIVLDLEIGEDQLEKIVTLRNVHVKIHRLNYSLSKSKFSFLAWVLKPFIRRIVRTALEVKIAAAISDGLHFLNRELLYARERLRATRIAGPEDIATFVKAVAARLTPAPDPDMQTRVGVKAGEGVFRGRYAPGSLVEVWEREGRDAKQKVFEYERGAWKNNIFDVKTVKPPRMEEE